MGSAADEARYSRSGPSPTFTDGRVVLLTSDIAEVRNAATGAVQRTFPVRARPDTTVMAYDGRLINHDGAAPRRITATDVGGSRVLTDELPGTFVAMNACGKDRVCVLTQTVPTAKLDPPITRITALDTRSRQKPLWQRVSTYGACADQTGTLRIWKLG
jgi:hypothetical protein